MKYEKAFREAHPETIGETDFTFDLANYCDWLETAFEGADLEITRLRGLLRPDNA